MADGQVNVRFSVQDAEVVSAALTKLGADGQAALNKLNAAGTQPSSNLLALSAVMNDLNGRAAGMAASLGPLGSGFIALGSGGLLAAAGIGAIVLAVKSMIDQADALAAWAQQIKSLADTTGLSTTQIQALDVAGASVGLTSEKVGQDLERFTVQLEQLRQGTGTLLTAIDKINPSLATQMASTKDTATAWNLLTQAYAQAQTQSQKTALATAAFGRGGAASGLLLGQGDLTAVTGAMNQSDIISKQQIAQWATLKAQIDEASAAAGRNFASIFTTSVLEAEKGFYDTLLEITRELKDFTPPEWLSKFLGLAGQGAISVISGMNPTIGALIAGARAANDAANDPRIIGFQQLSAAMSTMGGRVPLPQAKPPLPASNDNTNTGPSAAFQLQQMQQMMTILGPTATTTQQLALEQAKLNAEVEKSGGQYGNLIPRVMEYYAVQKQGADLQIQVQNGVASATDLYAQKQAELNLLVETGKLTQDQANASLDIYAQKTLPNVIAQQQIFKSSFPDLTKLAIDAGNLRTQLDSNLSSALQGTTTDMIAMLRGTETLSVGLTNLATKMSDAIAQAILMKTVVAPIANSLSGFLGGMFGGAPGDVTPSGVGHNALGNAFLGGHIVPFANGGVVSGPTYFNMGMMGEAGPEAIMPLQRGADGSLGVGGMAPNVNVNVYVQNNTSSDVQVQQQTNDSGGTDIVVTVNQISNQLISKGAFDNSLNARYGLKPGTIRR